ncbi:hypothetical protein Taro_026786 [Colocasia esculenta]|uniref:Transcription factor MYBS1 n=1 Tax=Colocasia esculenta TaxID=4460 RepID=A0A843VLN4_COLES|nr:hypothetical protein [Colocasia esculenta]
MTAVAVAVTGWSREQDKAFEDALAEALPFDEEEGEEKDDRRWEEIAAKVPGRTAAEVRRHYEVLVEDVRSIEAGKVPPPRYLGAGKDKEGEREQPQPTPQLSGAGVKKGGGQVGGGGFDNSGGGQGRGGSNAEQERRKGIPWTEEEHKLFLLGLDKFGKGDWRSISRNFVISRTPTQVASHAQKYFIRLNSMNRDRRRASIHDITSVNNAANTTSSINVDHVSSPVIGQMNTPVMATPAAAVGVGAPLHAAVKHPIAHHHHHHHLGHQPPMPTGMMAMYAPAVGQPAAAHMVSAAVGTPIMRPPPGHGHPPYVIPVAYPVPPPTMHP